MYYFDYASTTKPSEKVLDLHFKLLNDIYLHPDGNNIAGKALNEAKEIIKQVLKLNNSYEVVFTSGGTEANNLAIIGYAQNFSSKKHFITSSYEHSSVHSCFKQLEKMGHDVTYLSIGKDGQIDYEVLESSLQQNTVMVSIMAVNNEIGSINSEEKISRIIKNFNSEIIYMADCVQAVGKIDYQFSNLDIITISGHKLYAPKGIGAVIYKNKLKLQRTIFGGEQQGGLRAGTICTASALTLAYSLKNEVENLDETQKHIKQVTRPFLEFVYEHPKIEFNVTPYSNIASVNFKTKALAESIIAVLNNKEIYASTRSACSKTLNVPSRTLSALGLNKQQIDRTIRFSFSHQTTKDEITYLIENLEEILKIY